VTPLARPDERSTTAGTNGISGDVLVNDDQGNLPTLVSTLSIAQTPIGGSLTLRADGSFDYTPPSSVTGVVTDLFQYTITDNDGETSSSTLTIIVSPLNLVPFARPDTDNVKARQGSNGVQGNVLDNDDKGNLPTEVIPIVNLSTQNQGLLNIDKDGNYSYIPPSALSGIVTETFTYSIFDDDGETSSSTLTITVTPTCNAQDDTANIIAGGTGGILFIPNSVSGNVLNNDLFCTSAITVTPISISATGIGGSFILQSDGSYTYTTPSILTSEQQESFTYTATDSDGDISTATLVISVFPDLIPNAVPDTLDAIVNGLQITGNLLSNDSLGNEPTVVINTGIMTGTLGGTLTLQANGSFTYDPPTTGSFSIDFETYNYEITDINGDTSTSSISVTVTGF
jgi:hypothetical protein